jgi:hypothetical protein
MRWISAGLGVAISVALAASAWSAPADHQVLDVSVDPAVAAPKGGRLLVFVEPIAAALAKAKGGDLKPLNADPFSAPQTAVVATEVTRADAGAHLAIDLDNDAFPQGFSRLPPGEYALQALLDVHHSYSYHGRDPGDLVSPVVRVRLPLSGPTLGGHAQQRHPRP